LYCTRRSNALHLPAVRTILRKRSVIFTLSLPSVASFKFNYNFFGDLCVKFISVGLPCMAIFYVWLIDNINSKIVPLEKGTVVIYGANALSLLPVVLFRLSVNVHLYLSLFSFRIYLLSLLYVYDMVQYNKHDWLFDGLIYQFKFIVKLAAVWLAVLITC